MKRELLVFAGQSNMMGAPALSPRNPVVCQNSFEYKDKNRRLFGKGEFVPASHPAGEFSYVDPEYAYSKENVDENGLSTVNTYIQSTYFCPAMSNATNELTKDSCPFSEFSESTALSGASLAPILAMEWERRGGACAYAHIAKGGVSIRHYFTKDMAEEYSRRITEYNEKNGTEYACELYLGNIQSGAAEYFFEKSEHFFRAAEERFSEDDTDERALLWIQGESDTQCSVIQYKTTLEVLWDECKKHGFTKFFMLRIDFFGNAKIKNVMRAQDLFCEENPDCYMMTRALSFMPYHKDVVEEVYLKTPGEEYMCCRDTAYGYGNPHINEKGFTTAASRVADNMVRVLREGKEPIIEEELVRDMPV